MNITGLNKFLVSKKSHAVPKSDIHYIKIENRGYYTVFNHNGFIDLEEFNGEFEIVGDEEELISIH